MSRQPRDPRDPRDPFNDPFFNNNGRNGPFGFDPFNDPFFKQFEQIHQHIFRDFFGDDRPSIFIEGPNSSQSPNNSNNTPDLSQINPDAPPSKNKGNRHVERNSAPSFFRLFDHFFEPEYDDHKLSDINPNLSDNGPIMNNDKDNKGLVHPDGAPPGFRSPYLPNWTGVEKEMTFENNNNDNGRPKGFFRSQSITITTGPDGKTRKTTTIRDSNGQETTNTEEYDAKDNGFSSRPMIVSPFGWGRNRNNNDANNDDDDDRFGLWPPQKKQAPLFEQTHDPFARFRKKWQNWRWNPYNWGNDQQNNFDDGNINNDRPRNEWFWRHKNDRNTIRNDPRIHGNNKERHYNKNEGFKWRSYKDYQSNNNDKKPSLLDDIIKKE